MRVVLSHTATTVSLKNYPLCGSSKAGSALLCSERNAADDRVAEEAARTEVHPHLTPPFAAVLTKR